MHRLGNKNARIVFIQIQQQRRAVGHHRNKLFIADPRGIKQNVVAQAANFIHHLTGVVDRPVVGAQLNDRQAERPWRIGFFRRHFPNQITQVVFIKAVVIDTADKAKRISRCFEIDRRGPRLNQRAVVVRFMVVAVEQHQVAARQQRVADHFIRRRGAVEDKIGFVGIENLRRELLRMFRRAFVDQQVPKLHIGIAHIGAENVLAKEVKKLAARRVFFKESTVLMPRTGKGAVVHLDVLRQGIEERREQVLFIAAGSGFQFEPLLLLPADDRRHAVWLCHVAIGQQIDRQVKAAAFKQREDAAAAVRCGNDDCRHIGKISTVQRHHATVGREMRDQRVAGGNVH